MSRKTTRTCDMCKKVMNESDKYASFSGTLTSYSGNDPDIDIDLCYKCSRKLSKLLGDSDGS